MNVLDISIGILFAGCVNIATLHIILHIIRLFIIWVGLPYLNLALILIFINGGSYV
jgi:hypothetical protein